MSFPLSQEELLSIIGKYDGLVVRSGVTVDEDLIAAASNMRIVGRAGTGERGDETPRFRARPYGGGNATTLLQLLCPLLLAVY